jgi:hypothetical protein
MVNVASYLNCLFDRHLAVQTIAGHRSMWASALNLHTSLVISASKELVNLMESCKYVSYPDLGSGPGIKDSVGQAFRTGRGRTTSSLTHLTWKVTSLLLLALGCRRRELLYH